VRLGDVSATGRLRLDALARYLQDVAWDDVEDAGFTESRWVVRRAALRLTQLPRFGEVVDLTTSCTGAGSHWAERRTVVTGATADVESVAIWVQLDDRGRPRRLDPGFPTIWGEVPKVRARLRLPGPPVGVEARPWQLRATDVDVLGHLNNAIALAVVEDELARLAPRRRLVEAEVEYRDAVDPGDAVAVATEGSADELGVWLLVDGVSRVAARVVLGPASVA
jgi:acyl-ACP thioesterase